KWLFGLGAPVDSSCCILHCKRLYPLTPSATLGAAWDADAVPALDHSLAINPAAFLAWHTDCPFACYHAWRFPLGECRARPISVAGTAVDSTVPGDDTPVQRAVPLPADTAALPAVIDNDHPSGGQVTARYVCALLRSALDKGASSAAAEHPANRREHLARV